MKNEMDLIGRGDARQCVSTGDAGQRISQGDVAGRVSTEQEANLDGACSVCTPQGSKRGCGLNDEQRLLVVENMEYARVLTDSVNRTRLDREDLYQGAFLGLCQAALRYRAENGAAFTSYMHWFVIGEVYHTMDQLRGTEAYSVDDLSDECGYGHNYDDDNDKDHDNDPENYSRLAEFPFERMDDVGYVTEVVKRLHGWKRVIVRELYGLDGGKPLTVKEIAERNHLTEDTVHKLIKEVMCGLKELVKVKEV